MEKILKTLKIKNLFIFFFLCCFNVNAQSIDSLHSYKLLQLEKKLPYLPRIGGMLNLSLTGSFGYAESDCSFNVRRARLDIKGDITKYFDYRVQMEFASKPYLLDVYLRAKIKNWLNFQMGAMKLPFTLENLYSPKDFLFVDDAMCILRLAGFDDMSGVKAAGLDVGFMIDGGFFRKRGFNTLEYAIGIYNGNGINVRDNDLNKDLVGQIKVYPIQYLCFSASGYLRNTKIEKRNRISTGVRYNDNKWWFMSEYVLGATTIPKLLQTDYDLLTKTFYSQGVYAMIAYTFFGKFRPALRFDYYVPYNKQYSLLLNYCYNYTLGVDYWVNKYVRLMLNYTLEYTREKFSNLHDLHPSDPGLYLLQNKAIQHKFSLMMMLVF